MAAKDKTTTIVEAGAKGGVSAVMPYVAIGVIGFLGLKAIKEMDIDVGGSAGQIIESFTEGISETVTNVIDRTSETVTHISETVTHIKETVTETADVRVEPHGKTVIAGKPLAFSEFLAETRKGETMLPFYTGFLATIGHYGTGGLLTEPFIEVGRKTREVLPKSIVEKIDVSVYGAKPSKTSGGSIPYSKAPLESQVAVSSYQSYVSAGGVRAPLAPKTPTEIPTQKPTKEWKKV